MKFFYILLVCVVLGKQSFVLRKSRHQRIVHNDFLCQSIWAFRSFRAECQRASKWKANPWEVCSGEPNPPDFQTSQRTWFWLNDHCSGSRVFEWRIRSSLIVSNVGPHSINIQITMPDKFSRIKVTPTLMNGVKKAGDFSIRSWPIKSSFDDEDASIATLSIIACNSAFWS